MDTENVRPIRSEWEQRLAELRAEHDDVIVLEACGVRVAVRPPRPAEFERFVQLVGDEKKGPFGACRGLLRSCVLYPDWDELYKGAFTRRPGLVTAFGQELAREAGASAEVEVKKA